MYAISAGVFEAINSAHHIVLFWLISTSLSSGINSSVCLQFVTPFCGVGTNWMFGLGMCSFSWLNFLISQLAASVCSSFGGGWEEVGYLAAGYTSICPQEDWGGV